MVEPELQRWSELLARRPLTPAEVAELRQLLSAHPEEALADWGQDQALSRLLQRLPEAEVPSNFTALVLAELDREPQPPAWRPVWRWPVWAAPRWALACTAVLLLPLAYTQYQSATRARIAQSIAQIASPVKAAGDVVQLPAVDVLQDFEAIERLRQVAVTPDTELLASLETAEP